MAIRPRPYLQQQVNSFKMGNPHFRFLNILQWSVPGCGAATTARGPAWLWWWFGGSPIAIFSRWVLMQVSSKRYHHLLHYYFHRSACHFQLLNQIISTPIYLPSSPTGCNHYSAPESCTITFLMTTPRSLNPSKGQASGWHFKNCPI